MPDAKTLVKIGVFAGLGTGIVCLVDGLIWDLLPFNQYQGMFWLTFMPLILFFMMENGTRRFLLNMWLSFACVFLGFAEALGCMQTSLLIAGEQLFGRSDDSES